MPSEPRPAAAIELVDVVRDFGSTRVLHGVDLEVSRGAITGLLGPSGAGKTVTINHIVGLLRPSKGAVFVDGQDLARLSDEGLNRVRQRMGVVLQGSLPFTCGLFYSINVYENVAYPLRQRTRLPEQQIAETTMAHLQMVGLADRATAMPDQLSAGMCKRVAIARALALEAEIVIIDDFDSGIDGVRLALLCDLLADEQRRTGATFLVTTHDMSSARRLAENVAVIHEGRIVASGEAGSVFNSQEPLVRQLLTGGVSGPLQLRNV